MSTLRFSDWRLLSCFAFDAEQTGRVALLDFVGPVDVYEAHRRQVAADVG